MTVSPNQGSSAGGTVVGITGTNLTGATAVNFGAKKGTINSNSGTVMSVTSPSGSGTVNLTVTTPLGTSNPVPFYYIGAPFKASLSPTSGLSTGGDSVTITGTGLYTTSGVSFGGVIVSGANLTVASDSQISALTPGGTAGSVGVTVHTAGGSNNGLSYTYVDVPTASSISPISGSDSGGTTVTITGTNLATTQSVTVGGNGASFGVISDTQLTIVTPPGTAGSPVDVVITTTGGSATMASAFTYVSGGVGI